MMNKNTQKAGLRGEIPLTIGKTSYPLCFNWENIEAYESAEGESLLTGIQKDIDLVSTQKPLLIAASGGKITPSILKKYPLPLMKTAEILREIVAVAIWGPGGPDEQLQSGEEEQEEEDGEGE